MDFLLKSFEDNLRRETKEMSLLDASDYIMTKMADGIDSEYSSEIAGICSKVFKEKYDYTLDKVLTIVIWGQIKERDVIVKVAMDQGFTEKAANSIANQVIEKIKA